MLLPAFTDVVNLFPTTSTLPKHFKDGIITPDLKKASLNPEILENYRPVSNLSFVSKIVEKAVTLQISRHLKKEQSV